MKGFIKFVLAIALPIFCTMYASTKGIPLLTWSVFVVTFGIMLFVFRAGILMFIGVNIYRKNQKGGIRVMRWAYKTHKLSPSHQLIYAFIILRNGQLEEAETVISKALVMGKNTLTDEEKRTVDFNRALITWKKGDLSQAIVQLEELYDNGYNTAAMYGSLGSFYLLNKEYDKALELSQKAVQEKKADLVIYDNLGQAHIGLGNLNEALAVYSKIIPMRPRFLEAYYNYATILEKKDRLQEAKQYYEMALCYDEKFLSIITTDEICAAIERIDNISIENVKIEDIVYEGTTEAIAYDSSEELSDIEDVNVTIEIPGEAEQIDENEPVENPCDVQEILPDNTENIQETLEEETNN